VREHVPWLHLDVAGPAAAEKLAHARASGGATGFGVRAVVWAVLDHWGALAGRDDTDSDGE
jgi:leucyl aminopeptidase